MRVRALDAFRGLCIVLMVYFIMLSWFQPSLPDFLRHNVEGSLHAGDFVLPMFLFASGMSLVYFRRKGEGKGPHAFFLDAIGRLGKMLMVWLFLSPLTAGFLGMDEIMLSALLSVPTVLLVRHSARVLAMAAAAPIIAYLALLALNALPAFDDGYLGGYLAAPFYLPVMLAGAVAGKHPDRLPSVMAAAAASSLIMLALVPPHKMSLSPSFMALSVAISAGAYMLVGRMSLGPLEYLGRNPLQYWVLTFALLLIPLDIYVIYAMGGRMPEIEWENAALVSLACVIYLYAASNAIDRLSAWLGRMRKKAGVSRT